MARFAAADAGLRSGIVIAVRHHSTVRAILHARHSRISVIQTIASK